MPATPAAPSLDAPTTGARVVPDKPALEGLEDKWSASWKADDTYAFVRPDGDPAHVRSRVFSIDTPPPPAKARPGPLRNFCAVTTRW